MIGWLVYVAVIAVLLGAAALAAEGSLRSAGRSVRWAWAASMAGSVVLPAAAWWSPWAAAPAASPAGPVGTIALAPLVIERIAPPLPSAVEGWLIGLWIAASVGFVAHVAVSAARLRAARPAWERREVGGVPVRVSAGIGPAVVGVVRSVIVLPPWALDLRPRWLELLVAHEREHVRAGDPALLLFGIAALATMPWNPALWWQFRRLRLAMELDCDRRVLRRDPDAAAYGTLLLEVGRRRGAGPMLAAMGFSEPRSTLERRIRMMTQREKGRRWVKATASGAAAALLVVVACETPKPQEPAVMEPVEAQSAVDVAAAQAERASVMREMMTRTALEANPLFTPFTEPPQLQNRDEVADLLQSHYPPLLRDAGIGGTAAVWFLIDEEGQVQQTRVAEGTGHPALDAAAERIGQRLRFIPAKNRDERVPVWIQLPIVFRAE